MVLMPHLFAGRSVVLQINIRRCAALRREANVCAARGSLGLQSARLPQLADEPHSFRLH